MSFVIIVPSFGFIHHVMNIHPNSCILYNGNPGTQYGDL
jgi:hypothetical protein